MIRYPEHDLAAVVFSAQDGVFPREPIPLVERGLAAKPGLEIGWLGFPGIAPNNLCFFSGCVSSLLKKQQACLVDGVAINGVNGGPSLVSLQEDAVHILGVVSAYLPNQHPSATLPGLCIVQHVGVLHRVIAELQSLDDAQAAADAPPPIEPSPDAPDHQAPSEEGNGPGEHQPNEEPYADNHLSNSTHSVDCNRSVPVGDASLNSAVLATVLPVAV